MASPTEAVADMLPMPDCVPTMPLPQGATVHGRVNTRKVRSVLQIGASMGFDVPAWMHTYGLLEAELNDPDGLLKQDLWRDAWTSLVAHTGNEALGLLAASNIPRGYYGVIDYVIRSQATLGEGVRAAVRYFPLANTNGRIALRSEAGCIVASRHIVGDELGVLPLQAAEFALLSMVRTLRLAVSQPWSPTEIRFRHGPTHHAVETGRYFGCPIVYNAVEDAIVVDSSVFDIPTVGADAELLAIVTQHAERRLQDVDPVDDFESWLTDAIRRDLEGGPAGIDAVARQLGMSRRTLQRRLTDRGLLFRDVQRRVRASAAERLVDGSQMSIGEIAWMVGYADTSTFCRAFRTWTGTTPSNRRRAIE